MVIERQQEAVGDADASLSPDHGADVSGWATPVEQIEKRIDFSPEACGLADIPGREHVASIRCAIDAQGGVPHQRVRQPGSRHLIVPLAQPIKHHGVFDTDE